ncbi:MAG: YciI family protein [Solirubrobacteraceae bacterium]
MHYLLLICSDGVPTPEKTAAMQREVPAWIEDMDERGVRLMGYALAPASAAVTVRVRDGETLATDGPFVETTEFVGGFDVIDCADLDEAIEIAARHPVSWFHCVEVRPFAGAECGGHVDGAPTIAVPTVGEIGEPPAGRQRYLLLVCADGIPESDEEQERIQRDARSWLSDVHARGVRVFGHALKDADMATTVRVRGGETLLSDGPFVETTEFIGGFDILDCASREEAIGIAAAHPLARYHMIEVRPVD